MAHARYSSPVGEFTHGTCGRADPERLERAGGFPAPGPAGAGSYHLVVCSYHDQHIPKAPSAATSAGSDEVQTKLSPDSYDCKRQYAVIHYC